MSVSEGLGPRSSARQAGRQAGMESGHRIGYPAHWQGVCTRQAGQGCSTCLGKPWP